MYSCALSAPGQMRSTEGGGRRGGGNYYDERSGGGRRRRSHSRSPRRYDDPITMCKGAISNLRSLQTFEVKVARSTKVVLSGAV